MTSTLLHQNQDYQRSNYRGRVGHENKDLFEPPKENASEPLEQRLTIVRFSNPEVISSGLPLFFSDRGLSVYFIGQEYYGNYDIIVDESSHQWLATTEPTESEVKVEKVDTTEPTEGEVNVHGRKCAKEKALERFAKNAKSVIIRGDHRLISCYRTAAEKGDPCSALAFNALNIAHVFQESDTSVKERFVRDTFYLSVAMMCECDDLLERDQQEWNEIITCNMESPDELGFPDDPDKSRIEWATYALLLLSDLLSIAGGGEKRGQQGILSSKDLTPRESLTLFCCVFEVPTFMPDHLRTTPPNQLQKTSSRSKLFVEDHNISEVEARISTLESHLPIGLPDWAQTIEPELLDIFTARQWSSIKMFVSQTHAELPSLKYPQHSLRLLLVWGAQCTGQALKKLYAWAKSDHGTKEYHKMAEAFLHPNGLAETALILGAVKSLLRLCKSHPHGVAHLPHFIDIVKCMRGKDALVSLEHLSKAFDLVLSEQVNGTEYQKIREILALDSTLTYRQGEFEQLYWKYKCTPPRSHDDALEATKEHDSGKAPSLQ